MTKNLNGKLVAAVRIRGSVNVRHSILETLDRLHLGRPNNCAIILINDSNMGMIKKANNFMAYGEVSEEILTKILERGNVKADAKALLEGKADMKEIAKQMPVRLHPPRHGYKSTKLGVNQGGSLGYMGDGINSLIKRMV
jgi:large subunit ribosomal protein L30